MYFIGPHVSIGGGVANAPKNARALGATGLGMFVKNQRQWTAAPYADADIEAFKAQMKADGYTAKQVLPHAGYLINLANPDETAHAKSMASLLDELQRCMALGLDKLNFHPGSHLRLLTPQAACERVAASMNRALAQTQGVTLVVENTAGSGGNLGSTFEELRTILDGIDDKSRAGFCIDTMHAFAAGFDLRTRDGHVLLAIGKDGEPDLPARHAPQRFQGGLQLARRPARIAGRRTAGRRSVQMHHDGQALRGHPARAGDAQ